MKKSLLTLMACAAIASNAYAVTNAEGTAQRICAKAAKSINLLADFTRTDCTPAKEEGKYSLLFISLDPVFSSPASKKAYLAVLVAAVGMELNATPGAAIERVNFMDKELGRQRTYFSIPARDAARLQKEVHSGKTNLDGFYNGINSAGQIRAVEKK